MSKYEKLTHVEHVLKRPDTYVGTLQQDRDYHWIHDDGHFRNKELLISPALIKIFDEVLVNAMDQNATSESVNKINVSVDRESGMITVSNNGDGIPIEKHDKENIWLPELIFGHLLTSSNYDDTQKRTTGGRNGYGAKLTNIYSSYFRVTCKDPTNKKKYVQEWRDNMSVRGDAKITTYAAKGGSVEISFIPDWKRFGVDRLDDDFYTMIEKRVWDAAVCCTKAKVTFDKKTFPCRNLSQYAKMYTEEATATIEMPRWSVVVAPSRDMGFQQVSYVNGICTTKGGSHVDHVVNTIAREVQSQLQKKNKNMKVSTMNIRNCMFVWVRSTIENPTFTSQTKQECTLKLNKFGSRFEVTDKFIKDVINTGVGDEVMALSQFQENKDLKKTDGQKKTRITGIPKLDDANWAGTIRSKECTLIVTEGDSAKALAVAGLSVVGRNQYGVFPLRGKPLNVRDASIAALTKNQEFMDLKKIIGLKQDEEYDCLDELRYGKIMIMTDADLDGSHIKGLVLNMIHCFWPSLLSLGFVVSMVTPIIKATKGKQTIVFYTLQTFEEWGSPPGWKIKYYKGLGTSTSAEAKEYFKSLDKLRVAFSYKEKEEQDILLAFDKSNANLRKKWLRSHIVDPNPEVPYGSINSLSVSDFIHRDMVNFSVADVKRSIPHVIDGMKPSQRKVIFGCIKRNLKDEIKVAQLAGYISEHTAYHHGEASLIGTIVNMAQDHLGSNNNMNLLTPCGQFGTRLMGGKDAASPRYIFTRLKKYTRHIFDPNDDAILDYLVDDGQTIEPEFYLPTLPTLLLNGAEGIGTGFSTSVPPFNPRDIKKNIERIIGGEPQKPMTPWYKGFTGSTVRKNDQTWTLRGTVRAEPGNVHYVTELPPGRWTQDYKESLDKMITSKKITSYENHSTEVAVNFKIKGFKGDDLYKDLKLTKDVKTSNMYLISPSGIKKYDSAEDILTEYVQVRRVYYQKRKDHLLSTMRKRCEFLKTKVRFVLAVIKGEIVVFAKKKKVLLDELKEQEYSSKYHDDLLNIKTIHYTKEAAEKLVREAQDLESEITAILKITPTEMWQNDMNKFNI